VERAGGFSKVLYDLWVSSNPVYNMIYKKFPPPQNILEVGSGFGISTALLSLLGYKVTAIDINPTMIEHTLYTVEHYGNKENVTVSKNDAFNLSAYYKYFNIVFSSGVLEHFIWNDVVTLLKEQAKTAPYIISVIPTRHHLKGDDCNRRIYPYTIRNFKKICKEAGLSIDLLLAYGDTNKKLLVILRHILPSLVWYHLRRRFFAVTIATLCRSNIFIKRKSFH